MNRLNSTIRKAALLIAPVGLLAAGTLFAHDPYGDRGSTRHHQQDEKEALKEHQREERYYYGNSRALREHQKQEKREMRQHQRNERDGDYYRYGDRYGYDRDSRYSDRNGYYDRDYRYDNRGYGRRY